VDFLTKFKLSQYNTIGLISFVLTFIGLIYLGRVDKICHLIFMVSYSLQIYLFYKQKQYFLIMQMTTLFLFSIANYSMWLDKGL
jgi:hypothetical protein